MLWIITLPLATILYKCNVYEFYVISCQRNYTFISTHTLHNWSSRLLFKDHFKKFIFCFNNIFFDVNSTILHQLAVHYSTLWLMMVLLIDAHLSRKIKFCLVWGEVWTSLDKSGQIWPSLNKSKQTNSFADFGLRVCTKPSNGTFRRPAMIDDWRMSLNSRAN